MGMHLYHQSNKYHLVQVPRFKNLQQSLPSLNQSLLSKLNQASQMLGGMLPMFFKLIKMLQDSLKSMLQRLLHLTKNDSFQAILSLNLLLRENQLTQLSQLTLFSKAWQGSQEETLTLHPEIANRQHLFSQLWQLLVPKEIRLKPK